MNVAGYISKLWWEIHLYRPFSSHTGGSTEIAAQVIAVAAKKIIQHEKCLSSEADDLSYIDLKSHKLL